MVRARTMIDTGPNARASILAVLSAMAIVVLDAGLLNVALPSIAGSLKATPAEAVLAVTAYQTALLVGLLPCAHVADRFGHRRLFAGGLAVFSVASIACAFAINLSMLVVARAVQGVGGAAILALGIALLRLALGPQRVGQAIAWNALTVALCSAAGPIVGAVLLAAASWPWLFFIKLPICAVALVAARGLPETKVEKHVVDAPGIGLHAATATLFVAAAGIAVGHLTPALLFAGMAVALGTALFRREMPHAAPLWPIDLLRMRPFRSSVIASICCFTAQSAGLLALPFHLQVSLGHGPIIAGLVLTCWPLTVAVTSVVANRLSDRFGSASLCAAGGTVLGAGLLLSALSRGSGGIALLVIGAALSGLGFGLFQVPNNRVLFLTAPAVRSAAAGGMQGTARLIGQTMGALLIGLLFTCASGAAAPRFGFAVGAAFAIAGAMVSATEAMSLRNMRGPGENAWPRPDFQP
jgi:DHA2 family multidrug resistance protein-like MFS transporter